MFTSSCAVCLENGEKLSMWVSTCELWVEIATKVVVGQILKCLGCSLQGFGFNPVDREWTEVFNLWKPSPELYFREFYDSSNTEDELEGGEMKWEKQYVLHNNRPGKRW